MNIQVPQNAAGARDEAGGPGIESDRSPTLGPPLEPEADDKAADENVAKHEFEHALKTAFTKP